MGGISGFWLQTRISRDVVTYQCMQLHQSPYICYDLIWEGKCSSVLSESKHSLPQGQRISAIKQNGVQVSENYSITDRRNVVCSLLLIANELVLQNSLSFYSHALIVLKYCTLYFLLNYQSL